MAPRKKKINYIYAVGKRKTASARVRLYKGKAESTVNEIKIDKYFSGKVAREVWSRPFKVLDLSDKYYVTIRVVGGGINSQLEASSYGIAKAFLKENEEKYRKLLKDAGLLRRDARIRERRKAGTGGKARRKKQSPKR